MNFEADSSVGVRFDKNIPVFLVLKMFVLTGNGGDKNVSMQANYRDVPNKRGFDRLASIKKKIIRECKNHMINRGQQTIANARFKINTNKSCM